MNNVCNINQQKEKNNRMSILTSLFVFLSVCLSVCVRACARVRVRACVRTCVCVRVCVRAYMFILIRSYEHLLNPSSRDEP